METIREGILSQIEQRQEISISELFSALYKAKLSVIIGTLLFAILSVAIALSLPNKYKSRATLIVNSQSSGGLASLAGSLGGLAGMAGINLSGGQDNVNPMIARELVTSQAFILEFIDKHNLLVDIMATEGWDKQTDKLIVDTDLYDKNSSIWLIGDNPTVETRPKREDIVKEFRDIIQLNEDSKTGVLTLSAEFYSPALAQQWLTWFIDDINETIRRNDIEESTKSIKYLEGLIRETDNTHFLQTFNTLIEEQSKKLMLSKVRTDYVFKTIDPPTLAEKKSKPSRALICVLGTFLGGIVMCLFVLVRHFIKKDT